MARDDKYPSFTIQQPSQGELHAVFKRNPPLFCDGRIVDTVSFDESALMLRIAVRERNGRDAALFKDALVKLRAKSRGFGPL